VGVGLFSLLLSNIDKYIINYYLGLKTSSLYSATYSISEQSLLIITSIIGTTTIQKLVERFELGGIRIATDFQSKILKLYLIVSLPILAFLNMNYEEILILYLGVNYSSSFCIFPLISFAAFFFGLSNIFSELFVLIKRTKTLFNIYLLALIMNLVMNILLIKDYGMFGAGIATFISHFFILLLMFFGSRNIGELKIVHLDVFKLILSISIMMTCNYLIKLCINLSSLLNLAITLVSTFTFFFLALFSLRLIDLKDLKRRFKVAYAKISTSIIVS
jgi:O-antigen/teichoic acid export membrane protein